MYRPLLLWPQIPRLHCSLASLSVRKPSIMGLRLTVFGVYSCPAACFSVNVYKVSKGLERQWGFAVEAVQIGHSWAVSAFSLRPSHAGFNSQKGIHTTLFPPTPAKHMTTYSISPHYDHVKALSQDGKPPAQFKLQF